MSMLNNKCLLDKQDIKDRKTRKTRKTRKIRRYIIVSD